jgi:hypothetical protein
MITAVAEGQEGQGGSITPPLPLGDGGAWRTMEEDESV